MTLEIPCPNCGAVLKAPAGMAGHKARCKKCQHGFRLPELADEPVRSEPESVSDSQVPAFDFETPPGVDANLPTSDATRSKPKYQSSISGSGPARRRGDGSRAGLFLTLFGVLALLSAVAVGGFIYLNPEKPAPASATGVPKEKPADTPKEKEKKDSPKPEPETPPRTNPGPKPVTPKAAERPKTTLTGGLKLEGPPAKVESFQKPEVRIAADLPSGSVRQVFLSGGESPVAVVVWASEPGFQNQGAKDTVDRYNLSSGDRIDRTEVELGALTWPRANDLSLNGELFVNEGPAGTLTRYDLNAKTKAGTPFKPFADDKTTIAAAFFTDDKVVVAISSDGKLETWDSQDGKKIATGSLGTGTVATRSVAMNTDRTKLMALSGGSLVEVPVKSLVPSPVLNLPRGPGYGYAMAMAGERVAIAYRATMPASHTLLVVARLGDPKPSMQLHLDDSIGLPDRIDWCGAEAFTVAFEKTGTAMVVETEVNKPMAVLFPKSGAARHALGSGQHLVLIPDPADVKKSLLLGIDFPPNDYLPLRNEAVADKKPVPFLLTPDGIGR